MDEPPHFFQFFFLYPAERIEIVDFTGDAAVKRGGIKMSDWADATFAGEQVAPDFIGANAAARRPALRPSRQLGEFKPAFSLLEWDGRADYLLALACFSI